MSPAFGYVGNVVIPAAMSMLPVKMDAPAARAMLLAIGLQESRFEHRRQIRGPARGFPQFEVAGVRGVLTHQASRPVIVPLLRAMAYEPEPEACHAALEHNDILACIFARLLLWTHPGPLPMNPADGWAYYLSLWRPGKPHRETWDAFFIRAWEYVEGGT